MKIVRKIGAVLVSCGMLAVMTSSATAQMRDVADLREIKSQSSISLAPATSPFSLLDLSRLKWSHSYSLVFGSGSAGSGSLGMYTSSLSYEFSSVLSLAMSLGVGHNPGALFNQRQQSNAIFFPSMTLDYHPNDNFRMRLSVARSPYGSGYYGNPYSSSRFGGLGSISPFYDPFGTGLR